MSEIPNQTPQEFSVPKLAPESDLEESMNTIENLLGKKNVIRFEEEYNRNGNLSEAMLEELEGLTIEIVAASIREESNICIETIEELSAQLFEPTESEESGAQSVVRGIKSRIEGTQAQFISETRRISDGDEVFVPSELGERVQKGVRERIKSVDKFVQSFESSSSKVFTYFTGEDLTDEAEFKNTPFTVELYLSEADYKRFRSLTERGFKSEDDKSGGIYKRHNSKYGVVGLVLALKDHKGLDKIVEHERQHALLDLVEEKWKKRLSFFTKITEHEKEDLFKVLEMTEGEDKELLANAILKTLKKAKLEYIAKDEALAFYRMGAPKNVIENELINNPKYNNFSNLKPTMLDGMVRHGLSEEQAQSIFEKELESGYELSLKEATDIMFELEEKGLSRSEVANFLVDKKLENWPKEISKD